MAMQTLAVRPIAQMRRNTGNLSGAQADSLVEVFAAVSVEGSSGAELRPYPALLGFLRLAANLALFNSLGG